MGWFRRKTALDRRCHACGRSEGIRVWYAAVRETRKRFHPPERRKVYSCPSCFYKLPEGERTDWTIESGR